MSFAQRHIQTAEKIIGTYDGTVPLHHYLKQFFSADKKYGSKDRKAISHACYCFYRLGHSLQNISTGEKIKAGIFLCTDQPGNWSAAYDENWLAHWMDDLDQKIAFLQQRYFFMLTEIYPLHNHITSSIDRDAFIRSHLIQPDLHIRARLGKINAVTAALQQAGLHYTLCGNHCIALPNGSKIDTVVTLNRDAVVQDLSSQSIATFLHEVNKRAIVKTWDCCAASGGKSILAVDTINSIDLTVSDIRASIIQNLRKRFAAAGITRYHSFVADMANASQPLPAATYDLVICDVPCSGSGTWGRTPEQLYFSKEEQIGHYTGLQQRITRNVIPHVADNGYLLYITCSVFKEENEAMADFIVSNSHLRLQRMEVLKGYDKKADTMFAALFTASPL